MVHIIAWIYFVYILLFLEARFANYQIKTGIIALLNKFKAEVCDKTCVYHIVLTHDHSFQNLYICL